MKKIKIEIFSKKWYPLITLFLIILTGWFSALWAQRPRNIPPADDYKPFQVDPVLGIIIYIILPVFFLILFILWRRREKKRREDRMKDQE